MIGGLAAASILPIVLLMLGPGGGGDPDSAQPPLGTVAAGGWGALASFEFARHYIPQLVSLLLESRHRSILIRGPGRSICHGMHV